MYANIILPIVAAFVGLVVLVGAVTYYGSQKISLDNPDISPLSTSTNTNINPNFEIESLMASSTISKATTAEDFLIIIEPESVIEEVATSSPVQ